MSTTSEKRLIEAARRCDGKAIEEIVRAGKTNLDAADQKGCTAVHLCTKSADLSSLALLLENGAKTDIFDSSGMVALHHAATKDYVETMALLISYGADVNRPNEKNNMTALHYATCNKRRRSVDFLLFCGADFSLKDEVSDRCPLGYLLFNDLTRMQHTLYCPFCKNGMEAMKGMSDSERLEHSFVQDGYKTGQIQFSGKMLYPHCEHKFESLDMSIISNDSNNHSICFFCRRVALNYAHSTVKEGDDIISDVFQYLVNRSSDNVSVTIPGYSFSQQFDEAFVKDHTGNTYKCSLNVRQDEDSQSFYYTATIKLSANDEGQAFFMVVAVGKEERFIATGKHQIMQSRVEEGFRVEAPEKSLLPNSTVALKVLPTQNHSTQHMTRNIDSMSNFCEVDLSSRQRRPITLTLPLPASPAPSLEVIVYHSEENQTTESSWNMMSCHMAEEANCVTVTDPSVGRGTAIVMTVLKKKEEDFVHKVKKFLSWLYDKVTKRIKPYVFSVLTKSSDGLKFRVLVLLAEEKTIENSVEKFKEENFQTQKSQRSGPIMVKPSNNFLLKLDGNNAKVQGQSSFRISAQSKRISQHEFLVLSKQYDFVQLLIYELKANQKLDSFTRMPERNNCLVQINTELRMEGSKDVQHSFTEFPDSAFLCELAGKIGEEWFLLGVSLGLDPSYLETIQRANGPNRANQTMLYTWRADNDSKDDMGVTKLIKALTITGRNDLVMLLNRFISNVLIEKPQERISKWARKLLSNLNNNNSGSAVADSITNFNSLIHTDSVPDPATDEFLVKVCQIIGPLYDIVPQLGIKKEEVEAMQNTLSPYTVMLKCLIQCRRKHGDDPIQFLDELLEALTASQNNLAASEIMHLFNQWLRSSASKRDREPSSSNIHAFCEKFGQL